MNRTIPFGEWLRQRRNAIDLTQWQLAERVGCSRDAIQKIESGSRRPSKQVAELLAACLAVPQEERPTFVTWARLGGEGPSPSPLALPTSPSPVPPSEPEINRLPIPLTSLIGREHVIAEVQTLLLRDDVRLLTLVGPPGIGKTRLCIAAASAIASASGAFQDGVHFVPLESTNDPGLVASAIAQVLGVKVAGSEPILTTVARSLRRRSVLLVLDNFEQVLDAGPDVIELLNSCPSLKVLITSREASHVYGEWRFPVPPLALPDRDLLPGLEVLSRVASVALFAERAMAVQSDFALTAENAPVVAAICIRLDGLPLAIELAASRVGLLSLHEILDGLDNRLRLLKANLRNLPSRQRTLRGAIDWSHLLLQPAERTLFNRLGVFVGGWTRAAAEAICDVDGSISSVKESSASDFPTEELSSETRVSDGLASLVDKSLVQCQPGAGRYGMLEMLREYAVDRLHASDEESELRRRHAHYYAGFAEACGPKLTGPRYAECVRELESESGNLRAAIAWSVEGGPETAVLALRLTAALSKFWFRRAHAIEGRRWMMLVLQRAGEGEGIPSDLYRRALHGAGILAFCQCDFAGARSLLEQALHVAEEAGDKRGAGAALTSLGLVLCHEGKYTKAQATLTRAQELWQELADRLNLGVVLTDRGLAASCTGDFALAQSLLEESLAVCREVANQSGIAVALSNLGQVANLQGDQDRAQRTLNEALAMLENVGDQAGIAFCQKELGNLACSRHDYTSSETLYRQALALYDKVGITEGIAYCLEGLGEAEVNLGRVEQGIGLWGAADAIRKTLNAPIPVSWRSRYDQAVAQARKELGKKAFARAWAEGNRMTIEEAMDYALDLTNQPVTQRHLEE